MKLISNFQIKTQTSHKLQWNIDNHASINLSWTELKGLQKTIQRICLSTQCQEGQSSNPPAENDHAENETVLKKQKEFCFYAWE